MNIHAMREENQDYESLKRNTCKNQLNVRTL